MKKINDYYVNQHSCFLLQYHLVIVTKYRHPVVDGELKDSLIEYTNNYFKERDCNILAINTDKDHLHVVFEAYPNFNLANFINAYKSASSRMMRRDYSDFLSPYYWKPYFWSQSYFVSTVSEKSTQLVRDYVNNQDIR
jgi:putative transposase